MSVRKGNLMKEIAKVKSKITDKELFTSWAFKNHLKTIAETVSKRYKRPLQVKVIWDENSQFAAATDNSVICINANSPLLAGLTLREEKYVAMIGLLAHETGHVIYTDFYSRDMFVSEIKEGRWYPEAPEFEDEDLQENLFLVNQAMKDGRTKALTFAVSQLDNIFEDIYIESELNFAFPGSFHEGLDMVAGLIWENMTTVPEQFEKDVPDFMVIANMILSYARYGDIKDAGYRGQLMDDFMNLIPLLDEGIGSGLKERQMTVNNLLVHLWPYLDKLEDLLPDEPDPEESVEGGTAIPGGTTRGVGGKSGGSGGSDDEDLEDKRKATAARLSEDGDDADGDGDEGAGPGEVSSEEGGRIAPSATSDISEGGDAGLEHDDEYSGTGYERAADDIDRLLSSVASSKVSEKMEKGRTKDLNEFANSLDYGDAHRGVRFKVHRMASVSESLIDQYNAVAPALLPISKRLQRQIMQQLKDYEQGGKMNGLYMGKRLEARSIIRNDGRMFYKTRLPVETPQMAVAVVDDESGSMGWGDRATTARAASIILYDFCRALGIPIMIVGHTETSCVDLYSYVEYDSYDSNDKYRLMDMTARSNNRDGAALKYAAERLARRSESFKLLIVVSDGQPAADGYYGDEAERDMRRIKAEYQRRGVTMFAAAIGSDKENIHRIYGDGFLDVTNLNDLPVLLTKLVSRFIKK